jgi:hypothetical protein
MIAVWVVLDRGEIVKGEMALQVVQAHISQHYVMVKTLCR